MKKSTLLFSSLVAATLLSCTKTEVQDPIVGSGATGAYVSISIDAPNATRAYSDGSTVAGTDAENKISEIALLAFDEKYNFIANYTNGQLNDEGGKKIYTCTVTNDAFRFLVLINYTACPTIEQAMYKMSGTGTVSNSLYEAFTLTEAEVANMAKDGKFVMINAGKFDAELGDIPLVSLPEGTTISVNSESPTKLTIPVDRILARFDYAVANPLSVPTDAFGEILGVRLHATNTKTFTYSKIKEVSATYPTADYRFDPNMRIETSAIAKAELNWLENCRDEETFNGTDVSAYVLENTCDPSLHNYNNLTQAVIKARYTPHISGVANGESWFSVHIAGKGDIFLSFDDLVKLYKGELDTEIYGEITTTTKDDLDAQLNHLLSFSTNESLRAGDLTFVSPGVTLDALNNIEYGGYRAATSQKNLFRYYQNSLNYYDIFIQHDSSVKVGHSGRWGMVRNNAYEMNIKSILAPGLPFIPSPFDEEIIDPGNPDPEKPEPADELDGFIDAEITVNQWTTWTQDTDLK